MDRVRCSQCGEEHDLSDLEPCFDRPDAYFEIPREERGRRTWNAASLCVLWGEGDEPDRHFLRVVLPIPVRGEADAMCWGVWVEVAEADFETVHDRWSDPAQAAAPPFPGRLANAFRDMPPTVGLPGSVRLTGPRTVPAFELAPELAHPLAVEQREGVFPERVLEWLAPTLHPS
jgi:hypothetical protein